MIVSQFPKILEFRNSLEKNRVVNKYLIIVGGSATERDACIDYIANTPLGNSSAGKHNGNDGIALKKHVIESSNPNVNLFDAIFSKSGRNEAGMKTDCDNNLFVLRRVANLDDDTLLNLAEKLENHENKPNILIATASNRDELWKLPEQWRQLFDEIDLTRPRPDSRIKKLCENYAPIEEVDVVLLKYAKRYPGKGRKFIVEAALPELRDKFRAYDLQTEGSLITRVSFIRKYYLNKHELYSPSIGSWQSAVGNWL